MAESVKKNWRAKFEKFNPRVWLHERRAVLECEIEEEFEFTTLDAWDSKKPVCRIIAENVTTELATIYQEAVRS